MHGPINNLENLLDQFTIILGKVTEMIQQMSLLAENEFYAEVYGKIQEKIAKVFTLLQQIINIEYDVKNKQRYFTDVQELALQQRETIQKLQLDVNSIDTISKQISEETYENMKEITGTVLAILSTLINCNDEIIQHVKMQLIYIEENELAQKMVAQNAQEAQQQKEQTHGDSPDVSLQQRNQQNVNKPQSPQNQQPSQPDTFINQQPTLQSVQSRVEILERLVAEQGREFSYLNAAQTQLERSGQEFRQLILKQQEILNVLAAQITGGQGIEALPNSNELKEELKEVRNTVKAQQIQIQVINETINKSGLKSPRQGGPGNAQPQALEASRRQNDLQDTMTSNDADELKSILGDVVGQNKLVQQLIEAQANEIAVLRREIQHLKGEKGIQYIDDQEKAQYHSEKNYNKHNNEAQKQQMNDPLQQLQQQIAQGQGRLQDEIGPDYRDPESKEIQAQQHKFDEQGSKSSSNKEHLENDVHGGKHYNYQQPDGSTEAKQIKSPNRMRLNLTRSQVNTAPSQPAQKRQISLQDDQNKRSVRQDNQQHYKTDESQPPQGRQIRISIKPSPQLPISVSDLQYKPKQPVLQLSRGYVGDTEAKPPADQREAFQNDVQQFNLYLKKLRNQKTIEGK